VIKPPKKPRPPKEPKYLEAVEEPEKRFKCPAPYCKSSYCKEKGLINHHNSKHLDRQPLEIIIAPKKTKERKIKHEKESKCPAAECTESYDKERSLVRHHNVVHPERNSFVITKPPKQPKERKLKPRKEFVCQASDCEKSYDKEKSLVYHHNSTHRNRVPIAVKKVPKIKEPKTKASKKISPEKFEVEYEPESDLDEDAFRCLAPMCEKVYNVERDFVRHHNIKHPDRAALSVTKVVQEAKPDKLFKCKAPDCEKSYDEHRLVVRHFRTKHQDLSPYQVGRVGKPGQLVKSVPLEATTEKEFPCPVDGCGYSYDDESGLVRHKKAKHQGKRLRY